MIVLESLSVGGGGGEGEGAELVERGTSEGCFPTKSPLHLRRPDTDVESFRTDSLRSVPSEALQSIRLDTSTDRSWTVFDRFWIVDLRSGSSLTGDAALQELQMNLNWIESPE